MTDRFDEMAQAALKATVLRKGEKGEEVTCWGDLWDDERAMYVTAIAAFGRAQHKAGQEAMRERTARTAQVVRDAPPNLEDHSGEFIDGWEQGEKDTAAIIESRIRALPIEEPAP